MKTLVDYFRNRTLWKLALLLILIFTVYWSVLAARRYVSESHVVVDVVQGPVSSGAPDLSSAIATASALPPRDILLLRDYLLSADMLGKLDAALNLREHYSSSYDIFSRLAYRSIPAEWFQRHYRNRVSVEYDETAGVLVIQAQAYTPKMAFDIAQMMVREGERFMNELAQKLAREQVSYAEREVAASSKRMTQSRQTLLAFQNREGLVSPTGTATDIAAVASRYEGELSDLQARRRALEAYLAPTAPDLVQINDQIRAVEKQLRVQRGRLVSTDGKPLNKLAEEYDRLAFEATFQQTVYQTAISALERARMDASRMLKKVSVLQEPTLPEFSMEPGRLYYSTLFALGTLFLFGILQMLIAIVREHRD